MPKFKYVGDPNDRFSGPDTIYQYGLTWKKGEAVDVPENDSMSLYKLRGHSHFVDMSDKDDVAWVADRQKTLEKQAADAAKSAEEQRKRDEAEAKALERRRAAEAGDEAMTAELAPRPPGTVTREPRPDAFGGRTVEQRTPTEDHTKAGKTKS
jgi:hypothetical protein